MKLMDAAAPIICPDIRGVKCPAFGGVELLHVLGPHGATAWCDAEREGEPCPVLAARKETT